MSKKIRNLVFEGSGVLGIAYLGVLDYLYHNGKIKDVIRVAGTSSGAITACITSFNLSFEKIMEIADTLDYEKVPAKNEIDNLKFIPDDMKEIMDNLFGDLNCIYRLIHNYGWYSTDYFYNWIKGVIAEQFDINKKKPPYTFADFKNPFLHKDNRRFLDLYIVGTNLTMKTSNVFSYETTPMMEVAQAVTISMAIPLIFEDVERNDIDSHGNKVHNVYCDGGAINNYPINIFDTLKYNASTVNGANMETLGVRFLSRLTYSEIKSLLEYIESLLHLSSYIQQDVYERNPLNKIRSIVIDADDMNGIDFNIKTGDDRYKFLYNRGYTSAKDYFE